MTRRIVLITAYIACVVGANWMILHVGIPIPGGTHVLPVGFGLFAPSGNYLAAFVLVLRDLVQRTSGRIVSLLIILPAIAITALMNPSLALASGAAFALSETLDFFVYTPFSRRGLTLAVFASCAIGVCIDSVVFLYLAHIPFAIALPGLLLAKFYVALLSIPLIRFGRRVVDPVRVAA